MTYEVEIRNNSTGEIRTRYMDLNWDGSLYWWTEGNMGCDCNRELEWVRAGGPGPADDPHWNNLDPECGESRFTVLRAILEDGTVVPIDSVSEDIK